MKENFGDQYSDKEATRRMDDAVRRALNTPPKPHKELVGKSGKKKPRKKAVRKKSVR